MPGLAQQQLESLLIPNPPALVPWRAASAGNIRSCAQSLPDSGPENASGQGQERRRHRAFQGSGRGLRPGAEQSDLAQIR